MVSIHIVSYNNSRHTINAVHSILRTAKPPYEVLVLECGDNEENKQVFREWMRESGTDSVRYVDSMGNLGFSGGCNYLAEIQNPQTTFVVELNNDMFFAPSALENLQLALEGDPALGAACCSLTSGLYSRTNPSTQDVLDFGKRYAMVPPRAAVSYGGSNVPWMMSIGFFQQLRVMDVFAPALPFNKFKGVWDESIDPHLAAWCADWDVHNRILACGKQVAVLGNALAYHYEHCSIDSFSDTSWQKASVENYILKYGPIADMRQYGMHSKGLPCIRKPIPDGYPVK